MKSVLFVCHGNICRSLMAKYLFKYLIKDKYKVESRATSIEEIGNDMHYKTKKQLIKHNIPFDKHYAKKITIDDYNNFDVIVCFDDYNINNLKRILPNTYKVMKLLNINIADSWYIGDFDKTYEDIYNGYIKLIKMLD